MIQRFPALVLGSFAGAILSLTGCITEPHKPQAKHQGVYTIMAMEGRPQDMPETGYRVCNVFNHGIMPAAVVTGYGSFDGTYNHPQAFTLQVVEAASGTRVMTRSGEAYFGKASVYDLPIQISGNYRLKLMMNGSVYDTWDFVVNPDPASTGGPEESPRHTQWSFHFQIVRTGSDETFTEYDKRFITDLDNAILKEANDSAPEVLSQAAAGKAVIQFDLDPKGLVHSATIIKNTLNREQSTFFVRALEHGTPYQPWPAGARSTLGTGTRIMVVTFYLNNPVDDFK